MSVEEGKSPSLFSLSLWRCIRAVQYHGICYRRLLLSLALSGAASSAVRCNPGLEKLPNTYRCSVHRLLASCHLWH